MANLDTFDSFTAEVVQQRVKSIVDEMAITMKRTSGSQVVTETKDFSTALFDAKGEQIGFSGYITTHLGSSVLGVQAVMRDYPLDKVYPGDQFICNDPHFAGAVHQGDVAVIGPLFWGEKLVGWAFSNAHILDVGGMSPGGWAPTAYDRYAEALNLPAIKIMERGRINEDLRRIIMNNVRLPIPVMNDIKSLIAANIVANQRLVPLIEKYGYENFVHYCEVNKDLSEQLVRKRIASIPNGTYHTVGWCEYDGHGKQELYYLNMHLRVLDDEMVVDLSGSHPQVDCFANSGPGAALGCTAAEYQMEFAYDVPVNHGLWRCFKVEYGEPGTITNPVVPAAVSCGHMETGIKLEKMLSECFNKAFMASEDPWACGRVAGEAHNCWPGNSWAGIDQFGNYTAFPMLDCGSGGGGALNFHDGLDVASVEHQAENGIPDVETVESLNPVLYLWRKLNQNPGPGTWRGGMGLDLAWMPYRTERLLGTLESACSEIPANGQMGGLPGSGSLFQIAYNSDVDSFIKEHNRIPMIEDLPEFQTQLSHASGVELRSVDVFRHLTGNGAGLGDPLLRDPELVCQDIIDGYITTEHAVQAYGVIFADDGTVNQSATLNRRRELRRERICKEPREVEIPERFQTPVQVELRGSDTKYTCSHCGEHLNPGGGLYKYAVPYKVFDLAERLSQFQMTVKERTEGERVTLKEYYCPSCATLLQTDVQTDKVEVIEDLFLEQPDVLIPTV